MKPVSDFPASASPPDLPLWQLFFRRPSTRLGWWSVGLAATFVALYIISAAFFWRMPGDVSWRPLLIFYGIAMLLCGLAAGIVGLIAVIRQRERSWLVWLTMLPGLQVLLLLLGEFLVPH
jgi:hypothetical protein